MFERQAQSTTDKGQLCLTSLSKRKEPDVSVMQNATRSTVVDDVKLV